MKKKNRNLTAIVLGVLAFFYLSKKDPFYGKPDVNYTAPPLPPVPTTFDQSNNLPSNTRLNTTL